MKFDNSWFISAYININLHQRFVNAIYLEKSTLEIKLYHTDMMCTVYSKFGLKL